MDPGRRGKQRRRRPFPTGNRVDRSGRRWPPATSKACSSATMLTAGIPTIFAQRAADIGLYPAPNPVAAHQTAARDNLAKMEGLHRGVLEDGPDQRPPPRSPSASIIPAVASPAPLLPIYTASGVASVESRLARSTRSSRAMPGGQAKPRDDGTASPWPSRSCLRRRALRTNLPPVAWRERAAARSGHPPAPCSRCLKPAA